MVGKDDNLSFVLNAIDDVSFQQRPVPKARKLLQKNLSSPDLSLRQSAIMRSQSK